MKRFVLLLPLTAALACARGEGPLMLAGSDCMDCHGGAPAKALDAPVWTVAGTVYGTPDTDVNNGKEGVLIHLTDARSLTLTIRSNQAGNFYTAESLFFPLRACVESGGLTHCMESAPRGSCNECHTIPSQEHAPGRITAP